MNLSVVIATHNRSDDLEDCIRSLLRMKRQPLEIIAVDSSSLDNTRKLAETYPIQYISIREENRQRARNIGLSKSKGDIVAFIDDDVVVDQDWCTNLLISYSDTRIGGVGGRVIPFGAPIDRLSKIKRSETGKVYADGLILGNFDVVLPSLTEVDHLAGCNMSFRKDLLIKLGGFDENFIGSGFRDDTDTSLRIKKAGYKLIYQSKALVWHKFLGRVFDEKWTYWYVRNSIYFYFKNISPPSGFYFPQFLLRLILIPQGYIKKSRVSVKPTCPIFLAAVRGMVEGLLLSRTKRRLFDRFHN